VRLSSRNILRELGLKRVTQLFLSGKSYHIKLYDSRKAFISTKGWKRHANGLIVVAYAAYNATREPLITEIISSKKCPDYVISIALDSGVNRLTGCVL
jgi:hypothetical protein